MVEPGDLHLGWRRRCAVRLLWIACTLPCMTAICGGTDEVCSADRPPRPLARDLPSPADRARLHGCDASALYYGLDVPTNLKDARLCAFMEMDEERAAWPFQGAGMLMMIYFNGDGVARNRALAKQYACALRDYQNADELIGQLDAAAASRKRFDACEAAYEYNSFNVCDMLHEDLRRRAVKDQERQLVAGWSAVRRDAFPALKKAAEMYTQARTPVDAVDPRGSTAAQLRYQADFEAEFVEVLKAFDGGAGFSATDLDERDRELNAVYRKVLKLLAPDEQNDVSPEAGLPRAQLREAERRWLDYAAACETFRSATQSPLSADALRRLLIVQRTQALRGILVGHGEEP